MPPGTFIIIPRSSNIVKWEFSFAAEKPVIWVNSSNESSCSRRGSTIFNASGSSAGFWWGLASEVSGRLAQR